MTAVWRALEEDWQRVRAIRLDALRDTPDAFGSTYSREVALDESEWRARLRDTAWFIASDGDEDVGLAAGVSVPGDETVRKLVGMWVASAHRGTAVAADLVHPVGTWAAAEDATALTLRSGQNACPSLLRTCGLHLAALFNVCDARRADVR